MKKDKFRVFYSTDTSSDIYAGEWNKTDAIVVAKNLSNMGFNVAIMGKDGLVNFGI